MAQWQRGRWWHAASSLIVICVVFAAQVAAKVEQVHLALGGTETTMLVEFVADTSDQFTVAYSTSELLESPHIVLSYVSIKVDGVGFLHRAEMTDLRRDTKYFYGIAEANANVLAGPFSFTAAPDRAGGSVVAFLADFGYENAASLPQLVSDASSGAFDAVLHGGDIAYDLFEENGEQGNRYMRSVEPFAAYTPYMVAVGNHEHNDDFLQYLTRFDGMRAGAGNASGSGTAFYYSFDLGLVHYVAIDTELFAYGKETARSLSPVTRATQLAWLEQDLAAADANRAEVPWVVVFGHKGWYMAYYKTPAASYYQVDFSDFATLFDTYKVDLYLSGHNHLYQRFLPLAAPTESPPVFQAPARDVDRACASGPTDSQVYMDPLYTTHIVVGSPGNREWTREGDCANTVREWRQLEGSLAACIDGYGFGQIAVPNRTHLHWSWKMTARPNVRELGLWELSQAVRRFFSFGHGGNADPYPPKANVPYKSDEVWIVRSDSAEGDGRGSARARAAAIAAAAEAKAARAVQSGAPAAPLTPRRAAKAPGGAAAAGGSIFHVQATATSSDKLWEDMLSSTSSSTSSSGGGSSLSVDLIVSSTSTSSTIGSSAPTVLSDLSSEQRVAIEIADEIDGLKALLSLGSAAPTTAAESEEEVRRAAAVAMAHSRSAEFERVSIE